MPFRCPNQVTIPYVENFPAAQKKVIELKSRNRAFKSFLQVCARVVQPIHHFSRSGVLKAYAFVILVIAMAAAFRALIYTGN